jgi:hypothetical protein
MNDGKAVLSRLLGFAAVTETITGLALLIVPSLVGRMLLGQQLAGVAIPVARVAGIALIALGLACWPATPLIAMLIYNLAITAYLVYLGLAGEFAGLLLWPAVALHALLSILLGRVLLASADGNR